MRHQPIPENADPVLWHQARDQVEFKRHLGTYIIVIAFLWAIWYFTEAVKGGSRHYPWPVWPMLGWGIGVAFHFAGTYLFPKAGRKGNFLSIEKEYETLKSKKQ